MSALLIHLQESPEFTAVLDEAMKRRPVVTAYRPAASLDLEKLQMEKIKYDMARQEGFDSLMSYLSGKRAV